MNALQILESGEEPDRTAHAPRRDDGPVLSQWYWVKTKDERSWREKDGVVLMGHAGRIGGERLMCAMAIGSNYVQLRSPDYAGGGHTFCRVHFEDYWTDMRHEPNALEIIVGWARDQQRETARLMDEIQAITMRLGMAPSVGIGHSPGASASGALVALSSAPNVEDYKAALVLAKEKQLPELYEHVKSSNENLAALLHAQALPALATVGDLRETIKDIDARIFSVSLYAGLHEDAILVQDGAPAAADEKLHVMQSRLYMDEECLANYRHGGMEFKNLSEFDAWLCAPENLQRILPFPRTMVAMRVRRYDKDRRSYDLHSIVRFQLEQADKLTFLYVRNGQQVWCIQTQLEFDESIFPDRSSFDPNEPKMARVEHMEVKDFIGRSFWEELCRVHDERQELARKWDEEVQASGRKREWHERNPYRDSFEKDPRKLYHPVDHSSVYFDDAMKVIDEKLQKYNRVAVIIQGLYDRSPILQPHPPVKTWTVEGFDSAITLIYDGSETLHHGEAPDFEAYRAHCNSSLGVGSLSIGQRDFWSRFEAKKEMERRRNDFRLSDSERYRDLTHYKPNGNPGPGYMARVDAWSKKKGATFSWERDRLKLPGRWDRPKSATISCSITVPSDKIFNVDAYQLGDYRKFFSDRRTRARYVEWAPLLIAAEEHHFQLDQRVSPTEKIN